MATRTLKYTITLDNEWLKLVDTNDSAHPEQYSLCELVGAQRVFQPIPVAAQDANGVSNFYSYSTMMRVYLKFVGGVELHFDAQDVSDWTTTLGLTLNAAGLDAFIDLLEVAKATNCVSLAGGL